MKKILYTDFIGIDDVINSMLSTDEKPKRQNSNNSNDLDLYDLNNSAKNLIKKAINRNTLYKFWSKSIDKKYNKMSFPYGMAPNHTMIVACKNAIVAQELLLKKYEILENLQPYLKALKMTVKDLKFDAKKWDNEYIEKN